MRRLFGICPVLFIISVLIFAPCIVMADEVDQTGAVQEATVQETTAQETTVQEATQEAAVQPEQEVQQETGIPTDALEAQQAALQEWADQQAAALQATLDAQAAAAEAAKAAAAQAAAEAEAQAAAEAARQQQINDAAESAGMTYVDINIATQTLTYFVNGVPALSTPCVTGSPGRSTPRGIFAINNKVPGKYLTGPTWHVWVKRWMRFSGNCGIHDASWRSSFGGNIYKSNGSHGCVNIPFAVADQLYAMAPLGTMVIVH